LTAPDPSSPPPALPDPYGDAAIALRLCAIDRGLGGVVLRGGGDLRDGLIALLREALPPGAPLRRVPAHIDDERLLGGIDLTATLALGRAVTRAGLLAEADGGAVIVPMAERLTEAMAGRIAAVLDSGELVVERDATALRAPARFVLIALDDGAEPEERAAPALAERLAFQIDLTDARAGGQPRTLPERGGAAVPLDEAITLLAQIAAALGIDSARAPLFALRAARATARLCGREDLTGDDLALAARLVLGPRATRLPPAADAPPPEDEPAPPPPPDTQSDQGEDDSSETRPIDDVVLAAVMANLPRDVLARIAEAGGQRLGKSKAQGAGARLKSGQRGRPKGVVAGVPGGGRRLSVIDTLRAAAPWQKLRGASGRLAIRRDDLRVRRFETRSEVLTIFAVDASGSSAVARLAEAKGAVERLLAEAYVKRAHVALIAFRGTQAELLLPPTRSLTRARRMLAELPGGGGTPLAAGLNAARELAETARARGRTPFVIVLTDGRANIAADGSTVRSRAEADATAAARAIRLAGIGAAFVDTSARPRAEGAALAQAMGARYLALPRADSAAMHAAISQAQKR
jgi:magnesium chelatase subunit D